MTKTRDAKLVFADHAGRFYAQRYGFPPMAGRLLGYLFICEPRAQTIADLAEALLASRSAIVGASKWLEQLHLVRRSRAAGERTDRVAVDRDGAESTWFDPTEYIEQAALAREGLELLKDAPPERRSDLEYIAALSNFLVERVPMLLQEWHAYRDATLTKAAEKGK